MPPRLPTNPRFINLTGKPFHRWTVAEYAGSNGKHHIWKCDCVCGSRGTIPSTNLTRGLSKSCGCHNSEVTAARNRSNTAHGHSGNGTSGTFATVEYNTWLAMTKRCGNTKNRAYHNYGGRGIRVCKRWRKFENFLADMGPRPSPDHSIDRYPNNDGNYEPSNCRWATKTQQDRNRRTNRLLTHDGLTLCVTEWAERIGVNKHTLYSRLRKGLPTAQVLSRKVG